jgi:excisionase family DNA binding protein
MNRENNQLNFTFQAAVQARVDGSFVVTPGRPVTRKALSVPEAADELRVSEQQVINLIEGGELEAVNIGDGSRRHWRVRVEALQAFMNKRSSLKG